MVFHPITKTNIIKSDFMDALMVAQKKYIVLQIKQCFLSVTNLITSL